MEKCKDAMADELALKRLKAANETIEMLQRKIAATKQVLYEHPLKHHGFPIWGSGKGWVHPQERLQFPLA